MIELFYTRPLHNLHFLVNEHIFAGLPHGDVQHDEVKWVHVMPRWFRVPRTISPRKMWGRVLLGRRGWFLQKLCTRFVALDSSNIRSQLICK